MGSSTSDIDVRKQHIREQVAAMRSAHASSEELMARKDSELAAALEPLLDPFIEPGSIVACYQALDHELSLDSTIAWLREKGARIAYPRVEAPHELSLRLMEPTDSFVPGPFSLLEPSADALEVAPEDVDAIVVPGVAFTTGGDRLGYGGGYYDALLKRMTPTTYVVGVCFDFQVFETLPTEPHDRRVSHIVSV